jgi:hypothetical protein
MIKSLLINSLMILAGFASAQSPSISILGEGVISTEQVEFGLTFVGQDEIAFVRTNGEWGRNNETFSYIYLSTRTGGAWSLPVVAPFSGEYNDSDPFYSLTEKRMYFTSDRPAAGQTPSRDIWYVDKEGGVWGDPIRLDEPINSAAAEYSPHLTANGDLYFASTRAGGFGQGDIYQARLVNDRYAAPKNMGDVINSPLGEWNLGVSSDGNVMVFEASQRTGNRSSYGDLYITFHRRGGWTIPQNLKELNTTGSELLPLIYDGTLYFTSTQRMGNRDADLFYTAFDFLRQRYAESALLPLSRQAEAIKAIADTPDTKK